MMPAKAAMGLMPALDPVGMIAGGGDWWVKGVVLGVGAWLIMMVAMMPMAGAGFFGMHLGMMAPDMTLIMHLVFGAVLGAVYGLRCCCRFRLWVTQILALAAFRSG